MSVFYFLPVLLGFSAGKRFGASPYLSALLGACLLYLDFIALMGDAGRRHDGLLRHPRGSHELQLHGYPCHLVCLGLLVPVQVTR